MKRVIPFCPRVGAGILCVCFCATGVVRSRAQVHGNSESFEELSQRAEASREKGDVSGAIHFYHQALLRKPLWQQGWWYYGSLLYDSNKYSDAARALRRLTALNERLGGAWALLGLCEYETGDFNLAFEHLLRAENLGFGDTSSLADVAQYHLGVLLNVRGECDRARSLLSSLLLHGINSEDVQVAMGLSLLRVPLLPSQLDPSKDALIHDAGNVAALLARKQYDQADAAFRQLLAKYPATHFVHYAYGAMLASHGQEDLAKDQFREETVLTPDSALPYMEWAFLQSKAADYQDSVPLAQKAVELSPNSFLAHYLLGSDLLATGKIEESVSELEAARRLAPNSPEVRYSLGRAYAKAGKAQLARQEQAKFTQLQAEKQKKGGSADPLPPFGDEDLLPNPPPH
jgi:tetratricopeptide (TPR) repeat protein